MNGGALFIQVSQLISGICSRENQENSTVQVNHLTEDIGFLCNYHYIQSNLVNTGTEGEFSKGFPSPGANQTVCNYEVSVLSGRPSK